MASVIGPVHRTQQWLTFARSWWLYDAKFQCAMKSADRLCLYLEGRHKPIYSVKEDVGDYVVVMNSRHIALEGELWKHWTYYWHTGHPGRLEKWRAWQLHEDDPTRIVKREVYRRLRKGIVRHRYMARLFVFPDEVIPDNIRSNLSDQIRQVQAVPKRLSDYTPEEIEAYPRISDLRPDYTDKIVLLDKSLPSSSVSAQSAKVSKVLNKIQK